jgi:hypothetical protein
LSAPAATLAPARAQGPHGSERAWHGLLVVAALEEQVAARERDHADAGGGHLLGHALLHRERLHAQADAMAGRDEMGEAGGEHPRTEVVECEAGRVERLVGVQVERQPGLGGEFEEHVVGRDGVGFEVRAATDAVDAHGHGLAQQGTLLGAFRADAGPAGEGEHLDAHDGAQRLAHGSNARPT